MKITCFEDLRDATKKMEITVAVVEACDTTTINALAIAARDEIIYPVLIGRAEKLEQMAMEAGLAKCDIIPSENAEQSLQYAVCLINTGQAQAVMKGNIESKDFLKAIVNKKNNLLTDEHKLLSLAGLFEVPGYHKIFAVSDMVINTYPDLNGKKIIIQNAVEMLNALGIENPKVAVLAAVDKLNPKMPETVDAAELKKMDIKNCVIEGPISFDLATSAQAAEIKGYHSPVAGDADLLIVPSITSGNILVKCLTGFAGAKTAGTVLGAKVPVILTSRSAEPSDKYYSIALAACLGAMR
ncbi:MAG: phosphate acyltransferase [Oscillospiraceae bacterium]|nr:phosphate acyltransferase [Oscillospiraceae bacterium]